MATTTEPGTGWAAVLEQARTEQDRDRKQSKLTAVLAAALEIAPEPLRERRAGDFPPGMPDKAIVREAAQLLLDSTDGDRSDRGMVRRALARTKLLHQPQAKTVTSAAPDGEVVRTVEDCRLALAELGEAGHPVDRAVVGLQAGRSLRRSNRHAEALATLTHFSEVVAVCAASGRHDAQIGSDAPFLNPFLTERIGFKYAENLYGAYVDLQRLDVSEAQLEVARGYARLYADIDPTDYTHTWALEGQLRRRRRDVAAVLRLEAESKSLAIEYARFPVAERVYSAQASSNASLFQDFTRATELRHQRLQKRLLIDLGIRFEGRPATAVLMDGVERYRQLGSMAGLRWLGNITWAISSGYVRSGEAAADPQTRTYAEGMLDVAEASWDGFAINGLYALLYGRARLALRCGDPPTDELTADLLTANRFARQSGTAYNALVTAVRHGLAGSAAVRERLDELRAGTDPEMSYVAHARLLGLSAEWWWRTATTTATTPATWRQVEHEALAAVNVLRHEGVSLNPESEAIAWMSAARAIEQTEPDEKVERLQRLLKAIGCVTELMLTIATTADRGRIASRFGTVFTDASDLAVAMGDHAAADLIMEAVRRDRVGLLLAELVRNPDVDTEFRSAALAIQDSGSTTVGTDHPMNSEDARSRSAVIAVDRAAAVKAAESVLGPLSALADPLLLQVATTTTLLDRRDTTDTTTVVFQLAPLLSATGPVASEVSLLRRVTIAVPGQPVREFTDRIEIPSIYFELTPGDAYTFAWRSQYTPQLIPQVVLDLLAATPVTNPVRLMVFPTGFFHLPFDALPVTDNTHIIDHAVLSIHGSLTSALSLMQLDRHRSPTPAIAVYDDALTHAQPELAALLAHIDGVRRIDTTEDLDSEMTVDDTQPHSLLAMAVHGSADDHGWGQAKKLIDIDGNPTWITAAHVLRWRVPRLCVLASCNSPITTPDGIELGGFPLALMLRGATTVIGGLYEISDKDTSDIMIAFWRYLADGESPLAALRHAKLDYIDYNPDHRHHWPDHWAGLIAYGAANT